ncbi:hypothetical protein FDK21_18070 [Cohaesibacter sp. CAU 1516]|uniref:CAP domain-containing protein n=1 Tax=Cohaesibacter sp. CAU 1516 TaxID=2576038 RepID=UPI0010FD438A|nr:CAP domain-containing protein [Cohaesibacter sp. CAU 1516]TLP43123.1 hypothetical protein FDK21_18070 [Cohaesibacter sp. CAU 1516]
MAIQNDMEQLMLELINRARLDPLGEAERYGIDLNQDLEPGTLDGTAKQALAMNEILIDAARFHSQWIIDNDIFDHTGYLSSSPSDRMAYAGYDFTGDWWWGENLARIGDVVNPDYLSYVYEQAEGLFRSAGHRENTLRGVFQEVGIGQITGTFTYEGTDYLTLMSTQDYARSGDKVFVTGVAFNDDDSDDFYSVGEGVSGMSISVSGDATQTVSTGGYQVQTAAGQHTVSFSGGGLAAPITVSIDLAGENAKLDIVDGDTIWSSISLTLGSGINKARLLGVADLDLTGTSVADTLIGNKGDNILNGGAGGDLMKGGDGDDLYYVDSGFDQVYEAVDAGTDWVYSTVSISIGANVENLKLFGTWNLSGDGNPSNNILEGNSGANWLHGYGGDDTLIGGDGDDRLEGQSGADLLLGGKGDDVYIVTDANDTIVENVGEGTELVESYVDFALRDHSQNLENLTLMNYAISGTGNGLSNIITGNTKDNILNGAFGDDVMIGGGGNDTFLDDTGADRMVGGLGDDVYYVDNAGDVIEELADEGTDQVYSSIQFALSDHSAHLENLTLLGSDNLRAWGNGLANRIEGNAGNNIINGGAGNDWLLGAQGNDIFIDDAGADRMNGGLGNDVYYVDDAGDTIEEAPGAGFDQVFSFVDFALRDHSQHIENLSLYGQGDINGTGNGQANIIVGNAGNNILNGAFGNDTLFGGAGDDIFQDDIGADRMVGGTGNDTYYVDDAGDRIEEYDGGGNDKVFSSISFALRDQSQYLEDLTLLGQGHINGTGNALNNVIVGNGGNNILNGAAGDDTLFGGAGDDIFKDNIGADQMVGGIGNDTYYVDNAGDTIEEAFGAGTDHVYSTISFALRNQSQYLESLTLTGLANTTGTGNGLANTITGNDGNNILNGAFGNDILIGGKGNDAFLDDSGNDQFTGGEGSDVFIFRRAGEMDVITDFENGIDTIRIGGLGVSSLADITHIQQGLDTALSFGGASVTLLNFDDSLISADDFEFV